MKTKDTKAKKKAHKRPQVLEWPLNRENYILFGLGILVLIVGYFFLSIGPWDSFWSRTLAPIVLVVGYLIVIPIAILRGKKVTKKD